MKLFLLTLFYLITLLNCSTKNSNVRHNDSTLTPDEMKNDPNYVLADSIHRLLSESSNNTKLKEHTQTLCRQARSPLCHLIRKLPTFKLLLKQKDKILTPQLTKPLVPIAPRFSKEQITNWNQLRKSPIPNLLKGFLALEKTQLLELAEISQKENRCPNNVAVATAATLEDYLPDEIPFSLFARLYEIGGSCKKTPANDKENYLTRAGLFYFLDKNFSKAAAILSKVNATDAYSGRSLYWLYRAKKELKDTEGYASVIQRLSTQHRFSFHNLIAAHQESRPPIAEFQKSLSFSARSQKHKTLNPYIESIEILSRLGFYPSAHLIVDWLLTQSKTLEPEVRVHVTQFGDSHTKVIQLPGILMFHPTLISKETLTLNYPETFLELFHKYKQSLNPYLLMAIARRESSFNSKAVSPANAQGLLQLNPETVKLLFPEKSLDLFDPETNISVASTYLSKVLNEVDGHIPKALAAYNAGEAQVKTWEKRYPTEDRMLWMDLIPYRETRDYVANVLNSYHWYRTIYENSSDFRAIFP